MEMFKITRKWKKKKLWNKMRKKLMKMTKEEITEEFVEVFS